MKTNKYIFSIISIIVVTISCDIEQMKQNNLKSFQKHINHNADNRFKTVIGLIELHKLRNGDYPYSLSELRFLSSNDSIALNFVAYTKYDSNYELNLLPELNIQGDSIGFCDFKYSDDFWKGLGAVKSNLMKNAPLTSPSLQHGKNIKN